jgi:tetratricopeptide (TPR) repeat protein
MTMSAGQEAGGGLPSASDVRAALERILASDGLRTSPQLGAFLRFVVDAVLEGRSATLKGYTIGVEALGRDPRFNPQIDPIVRVEATRLRRTLERYYAGPGRDDPVMIELPRGGYAPSFRHRCAAPDVVAEVLPPVARPGADARRSIALGPVLAVLAFVGLASAAGLWLALRDADSTGALSRTGGSFEASAKLPPGNGMPTIAVAPLKVIGTPLPGHIAAGPLAEKIGNAFSRFDTVNVAFEPAPGSRGAPASSLPRADYRLTGSLEYGETSTSLRIQLIDTSENTIAWSRAFDYPAAADQDATEEAVVGALTNALLQSYGVIRSRDRAKQLVSPIGDPRYRCILAAAESLRSFQLADDDRARTCLEQLTAIDPSFGVGFEFLSIIYNREYVLGYGTPASDRTLLDRALRAARRATEINPASARAYQMLFVILFTRGDVAAAFAAGDKAMALNRYDMTTVAEYGGRLIMVGETERGLAMLRRADANGGGVRASWHHFYMFLGSYVLGDTKEAAFQAGQITTDDYPLGLVARSIMANKIGEADRAHQIVDRLVELQPTWRTNARQLLTRSVRNPEIVDRLLADLTAAGLPGGS